MRRYYTGLIMCSIAAHIPQVQGSEALASRLLQEVNEMLRIPTGEGDITRRATLLATPQQLAALCDNPELQLTGKDTRLAGRRTLVARCGSRQHFLPIRVRAQGTWWVARRPMIAGHIMQPGDIVAQRGDIEKQPAAVMFQSEAILGQRLLRDLAVGSPLLPSLLRPQWLLRSGQTVDIMTSGDGFFIRAQGKALSHASAHDTLRVQLRNGQTVSGTVTPEGKVIIPLAQ